MQAFQIEQKAKDDEFKEYPYRWVVVGLFGLCYVANAMASNVVSPIATKLSVTYDVTNSRVNSVAMVYLLLYTLLNFPANYIIDTRGLKLGVSVGISCICVGLGITLLINESFWFLILGSVLIAAGQPFIINSPAKIATFWFFKENRTFATSMLTAINLVGIGLGYVLPTLIVEENSEGDVARDQVFFLFLVQFFISAAAMVMVVIMMKDKPPTAASKGSQTDKTPFKQAIKTVFKQSSFVMLFIGFVFFYGTLLTFSSIGNFLFKPYGFTDMQISFNGIGLLVFGVVGSVVVSLYVKKTLKYMRAFKVVTLCAVATTVLVNVMLNSFPTVFFSLICMSAMGFLVTPILPLTYDLGCELVFPVGQALVTGILNGGGMIFSFALIGIIELAFGLGSQEQSFKIMIMLTSVTIVGLVFYWKIKPKLKRREHEGEASTEKQEKQEPTTQPEPESSVRQKRYQEFRDEAL